MDEVRWGMIGCGDVTERKSGPAFNRITHSSLVAVMGRNPITTADYARRHGVPEWTTDANRLFSTPGVNAIYIATPPDSHAEYTLLAARAGKAVYVEKPMARTHAECLSMISACREANVPLFVAYYRRCLPAFLKVKELVENGSIGEVRFVSTRIYHPLHSGDKDRSQKPWRVLPQIAGGGYFYDLGSHQLDFLDFLFGPIISVQAQSANQGGYYPAEDLVAASWTHENGVIGSGLWCFTVHTGHQLDETEILGSRGRIRFSFFEHTPVILENDAGTQGFPFPRVDPIQEPLIQLVVDELRGQGKCPSTGDNGARTNRILELILRS